MRKSWKIVLVALMVALLPLRSIAGAIAVFCPAQQLAESYSQAPVQPAEQGHNNESVPCGLCVVHCASGAFVANSGLGAIMAEFAEACIPHAERNAAAFIPDQLDRPPLALLR